MTHHHHPLHALFAADDEDFNRSPATNDAMVQELVSSGALRSPECVEAFKAVDRRHFWMEGSTSLELIYADMPLRTGRLHLSAPHIYAKALESLIPLRPGMSFLNVGSGTGYFNSIIGELTGKLATNHGIDIWPDTVTHARERCRLRGNNSMEFNLGNVYQLDVSRTMRYDRIYLGACANSRSKYLYRLLEVGGILIGPFQAGHAQQLRRVVRQTENQFNVEVLGSVQFACLVEPSPVPTPPVNSSMQTTTSPSADFPSGNALRSSKGQASSDSQMNGASASSSPAVGLPDVPFTFELCDQPWNPERCWIFPTSYKKAVSMSLRCRPRSHTTPCLPTELWIKHIFPWCPRWWFEQTRPSTPSIGTFSPPPRVKALLGSPELLALPELATPMLSPLPLAAKLKAGRSRDDPDEDLSDDGLSTVAPSSAGASSTQTTPESGPSSPPNKLEADDRESMALEDAAPEPESDVIFEVFSNGQRHAIGARGDPDDAEPDEPMRLAVPMHMLQMLRQRVPRWHLEEREMHFGDQDEDDDNDEGYGSFEEEDDEMLEQAAMDGEDTDAITPPVDVDMQDAPDTEMMEEEANLDGQDVL
jgi:protein-L-isoaspartate(D-aspartate) O-methyltransferase